MIPNELPFNRSVLTFAKWKWMNGLDGRPSLAGSGCSTVARVLNPKLARNQIMGGITFGIGMALLERVPYDEHTGQLIGEYYLPTHTDRPDFDIGFIDAPDYALDPLGVRGIGEIGVCGVAGAIANAIFHATGKRLRDLPITLEHLLMPYTGPDKEESRS